MTDMQVCLEMDVRVRASIIVPREDTLPDTVRAKNLPANVIASAVADSIIDVPHVSDVHIRSLDWTLQRTDDR